MELFADICVLSLRPIVNVPKARWTLCNFWRSHLNLWHIKAEISNIVEVHLVFDVLQFCHLLFKFLLLVSQFYFSFRPSVRTFTCRSAIAVVVRNNAQPYACLRPRNSAARSAVV